MRWLNGRCRLLSKWHDRTLQQVCVACLLLIRKIKVLQARGISLVAQAQNEQHDESQYYGDGASNSRSELNALSPELLGQCTCCCGVKSSVPCHCGPSAALLRCNPVHAVPTIDHRLASGNRGPDLNSTISHSRFDGFVPILEQSCWCQTTAAGNSWRRCLKLNGAHPNF
jgi:hypothetical protein